MASRGAFARAEQPKPRKQTAPKRESNRRAEPEPPAASSDEHFRYRYQKLQAARRDSSNLFSALQKDATKRDWSHHLLSTAEHMLQAFADLRDDDEFWGELESAEFAFFRPDEEDVLAALELLNSDLVGVLDLMGYKPPPPSTTLAVDLQLAVHDAISEPNRLVRVERTRNARYHMALYTYHLRPLVAAAKETSQQGNDHRQLSRRLLAAVKTGARALVPAAVAASAASIVFPPAGAAGGVAAAVHGLTEGAREFTKQGIELGSASLVAAALGNQEATASPEDILVATERMFSRSLSDLGVIVDWLYRERPSELATYRQYVQALAIEALRWHYQAERARLAVERRPGMLRAKAAAENAQLAIREISDWVNKGEDYDGLLERVELVLQAHEAVQTSLFTP